ncbi:hypothetical protein GWI33_019990 [Rhynchophorus ferrugineus]|uniref:Translation initiation factor IF-2, mitochondrial n=1 Tax=Rhynchophorus ferrugineus TaxID=354439 RepID=A0A834M0V9_RHYFE|nr:hypothetical protein GWI33_019990 [Rhynchophorus ferrugineus]
MANLAKFVNSHVVYGIERHSSAFILLVSKSAPSLFTKATSRKQCNYDNQIRNFYTNVPFFKRRKTLEERKLPRIIEMSPKSKNEVVDVWRGITLCELSKVLETDINYVKELFYNSVKDPQFPIDDVRILQEALRRAGKRIRIIGKPTDKIDDTVEVDLVPRPPPSKDELKSRPPVVTVMGHVDHGKTTLLDALRHSSVVEKEFGGITQHIGAFSVNLDSGAKITFLDTPGHAAFSSMRSRGANLTDIVILVVAADDGVMEQTLESIKMAKTAKVPIIVAINKIDAPKADVEATERMLLEFGIQVEKMGGDIQAIPISALKRQNLKQLTEALILQAELLEIGGDPSGLVEAVIVESNIHPFRGKLSTIIVQRGTLKKGDVLVAGTAIAKVRSLRDADGKPLEQVPPGYPAEIDGWRELPSAGELALEANSEKEARQVVKYRMTKMELQKSLEEARVIEQKREIHLKEYKHRLELKRKAGRYRMRPEGPRKSEYQEDSGQPYLNIIVRADVDGTLEAILETLDTYESDECTLDIVNYGVGPITQNDVDLAKTFNCVIFAFNVEVPKNIKPFVEENNIVVKHHNIIYRLIDDFKQEINARLPEKEIEEIYGSAQVIQQFEVNKGRKKIPVAGCKCTNGLLKKSAMFRLERNGEVIYEGPLASMRHLKSEVDIIKAETECGLQLSDSSITFEKDDVLTCFEIKRLPQKTEWSPGF